MPLTKIPRGAMRAGRRLLARRLLPAPARPAARRAWHAWSLRRTPAVPIGPIPELASPALADVFAGDLDAAWRAAREEIDAIFPFVEVGGAVSPDDRRTLWYLASRLRPRSALEIGTHVGGSTLSLAMALREWGGGGVHARLVTVDVEDANDPAMRPWERHGLGASPREMLAAAGCAGLVEFVTSRSLEYLAGRRAEFDLIFLDGDHGARNMYREIPLALRALRPGGCILLHDYHPNLRPLWPGASVAPGVWLAVERLRREAPELAVRPLGAAWGGRVSCLAMLGRA